MRTISPRGAERKKMLNEICDYLNNYFDMNADHELLPSWYGTYTISEGTIDLEGKILNGQYFRIQNSIFNDGIYWTGICIWSIN